MVNNVILSGWVATEPKQYSFKKDDGSEGFLAKFRIKTLRPFSKKEKEKNVKATYQFIDIVTINESVVNKIMKLKSGADVIVNGTLQIMENALKPGYFEAKIWADTVISDASTASKYQTASMVSMEEDPRNNFEEEVVIVT